MPGNEPFVFFFFSFHATAQEFENRGFTLKTHQMFSVHTTAEEFNNAAIIGHFGFVFEVNSVRLISWWMWRHRFQKAPFLKCLPSKRKREAGVLRFLRFEERFQKAPYSLRSRVTVEAAFTDCTGVVWTMPKRKLMPGRQRQQEHHRKKKPFNEQNIGSMHVRYKSSLIS